MEFRNEHIEKELKTIQARLKRLPNEPFSCARNGKGFKWYQGKGKNRRYVPKAKRKLAEQLAYRKYLSLREKELQEEQKLIQHFLNHYKKEASGSQQLLSDKSGYAELLSSYNISNKQKSHEWMTQPYPHNEGHPENLIHKTSIGIQVRSKSEAMIVQSLSQHQIPFRYEQELQVDGRIVYPDFTIIHPKTGKIYYWEHLGAMDTVKYCIRTFSKLQSYALSGIQINQQLIITTETKAEPLSQETIEKTIEYYFETF